MASRVTSITYKQNGTTMLGDLTYEYDKAGNRTKIGGSFARTCIPQAIASTAYNTANHQTTFGDKTLTYDNNGNLQTITDSNGTTTYTWNARNQLVGISGPNVNASFVYDGLGRREKKTVNSNLTEFLFDGVNPVQETSWANILANILPGLGIDEFLTRTDVGASATSYILPDVLGSSIALTDAAGAVQTEYTYEPFGRTTAIGASNSNPLHYTGRENDGTGIYFYRARYYHPGLQRFVSEDPISPQWAILAQQALREFPSDAEAEEDVLLPWEVDSHPFSYVLNSPTNFTDPTGEITPVGAAAVGCLIGGGLSVGADVLGGRKISWWNAGAGCAVGALTGLSGPKGPLFGRARYRGGSPGIFNRGNFRTGWSWHNGRNWFGFHGGTPGNAGHWHATRIPGPRGPLW
jgi:RHS repeat-associated protein